MVPVSDDVLMHWKYIKRVKKNGKWKYYYDTDQLKKDFQNSKLGNAIGYDEEKRKNAAEKKYNTAADAMRKARDEKKAAQNNLEKKMGEIKENFVSSEDPRVANENQQYINAAEKQKKTAKALTKSYEKLEKANADYDKTLLSKTRVAQEKGKAFIESIGKKVESAKDKAGVDEKERLKNAAANRATSESEREVNFQKYVTSYDEYHNAEHPQLKQEAKRRLDVYENSYESSRNKVSTARSEYEQALNEYINTPIGKIEGSIYFMQGQKYYERLLKSRRKIISSDGSVKYLHEKD
jgi:hypothetical protein